MCNKLPYFKAKMHFCIALNTSDVRGTSGNGVTVAPACEIFLLSLRGSQSTTAICRSPMWANRIEIKDLSIVQRALGPEYTKSAY